MKVTWSPGMAALTAVIAGCPAPGGGLPFQGGIGLSPPLVLVTYRARPGVAVPAYCSSPETMMTRVAKELSQPHRHCSVDTVATPWISEMLRMTCQWNDNADRCDHIYWVNVWAERTSNALRDYRLLGLAWVTKIGCVGEEVGRAFAAEPAVLRAATEQNDAIRDILAPCRGGQ